jgi:hypothetical protein
MAILLGFGFGLWSTWRLRHDTAELVVRRPDQASRFLFTGWLVRFLPAVALIGLLVAWSPVAGSAALAGYWMGRTTWLGATLVAAKHRR